MAWISKDGSHKDESFAHYSMDQLREYLAKKRRIVGPHPEGNCPHGCKDCFTKDSFVRPWPHSPEPRVTGLSPGMTTKTPEQWWKRPLRLAPRFDEGGTWLVSRRGLDNTFLTMSPPKPRLLATSLLPVKEELKTEQLEEEQPSVTQKEELEARDQNLDDDEIPASQPRGYSCEPPFEAVSQESPPAPPSVKAAPPGAALRAELVAPHPPSLGVDPWEDLLWENHQPGDRDFPPAPPSQLVPPEQDSLESVKSGPESDTSEPAAAVGANDSLPSASDGSNDSLPSASDCFPYDSLSYDFDFHAYPLRRVGPTTSGEKSGSSGDESGTFSNFPKD